jgi:hypothetical protein
MTLGRLVISQSVSKLPLPVGEGFETLPHHKKINLTDRDKKPMQLILYSKPGCHLCEGLLEKLQQVKAIAFELEVRDITTRPEWFEAYQYEVPVLCQNLPSTEKPLPRPSPRASVQQLEQLLQKYLSPES